MVYVVLQNDGPPVKKFKAKNDVTLSYTKDNSITHLPLPDLPEESTNVIKVAGVLSKWKLSFTLISDSEDLSMGTETGGVRSVWEQIDYLTKNFVTEKIGQKHRVIIPGVLRGSDFVKVGAFSNIAIDFQSGVGEYCKAAMELLVGTVV